MGREADDYFAITPSAQLAGSAVDSAITFRHVVSWTYHNGSTFRSFRVRQLGGWHNYCYRSDSEIRQLISHCEIICRKIDGKALLVRALHCITIPRAIHRLVSVSETALTLIRLNDLVESFCVDLSIGSWKVACLIVEWTPFLRQPVNP